MNQITAGLFGPGMPAYLHGGLLAVLLVLACVHDVRSRRIPNRLVLATALLGVLLALVAGGLTGAGWAGAAMLLGLAVWLPFYALGWMGAGDVKLFAAAGAWLTMGQLVNAALLSAFAGGALALVWMLRALGPTGMLARIAGQPVARSPVATAVSAVVALGRPSAGAPEGEIDRRQVPYGVAMTAGLLLAWAGVAVVRL